MKPKDIQPNLYSMTLPYRQPGWSPVRPRGRDHSAKSHKFIIGQILAFSPDDHEIAGSGDSFRVVRLLPPESGDNQYRLESVVDGHERVVRESQLALA
jgi:hypothetical protein